MSHAEAETRRTETDGRGGGSPLTPAQVAALQESEQFYRAIFASVNDAIIIYDATTFGVVDMNRRACELLGYSVEEARRLNIAAVSENVPPYTQTEANAFLTKTAGGEPQIFEWRVRNRSGELVWVEISMRRAKIGSADRIIVVLRETSLRKLAEQESKESEERFRTLVDNAPDAIFVQTGLVFMYVNTQALRLCGAASADELLGRSILERVHPRCRESIRERNRILHVERHSVPRIEQTYLKVDGTEVHVEVSAVPSLYLGKHGALVFVRDITDRKQAELAFERTAQELKSFFRVVPDLLCILNGDGRFVRANPEWHRALGYKPQELQGRLLTELVHPKDMPAMLAAMADLRAQRKVRNFDYRCLHKDGSWRWLEWSAHPVGQTIYGASRDITERRLVQEELARAKEAGDAANLAKDRFMATLSHELRTPLTPVLAAVSSLQDDPRIPADVSQDLAMVLRNVELEARLIDDLLDLTRITRGKLRLALDLVDLHKVLQGAIEISRPDLTTARMTLEMDLGATGTTVLADGARLHQVFWNIIKNAVQNSPPDSKLMISTRNAGDDTVCVSITDFGRGMTPHTLGRIFRPFEQGPDLAGRRDGGLGLGLSICRSVMEMHGGSVTAASAGAGNGSTFIVTLKTTAAQPQLPLPPVEVEHAVVASQRILLVEDHPATLEIMARILRKMGHQVATATRVAEAIERLRSGDAYDLLISDLGLPDGTGLEVAREARARSGLHAIALSGYGMEEDVEKSLQAGFELHLTKPIDVGVLRDAIAKLCGR